MVRKSSRSILMVAVAAFLLVLPVVSAQTVTGGGDTVIALLDRIDRIVAGARHDLDTDDVKPVATTGSEGASATVTMRAEDLDEIRADIAQVKLLLRQRQ